MFRSLRIRLFLSFFVIVIITLVTTGLVFTARLGGYRDQLTASTLREVAEPIYYNLTLFPTTNGERPLQQGRRLQTELITYLQQQAQDSHVVVLLVDNNGTVFPESTTDEDLQNEHFAVPPPPQRGPNFGVLPQQKFSLADDRSMLYVMVPMPESVRVQRAGLAAIVVALPEANARDVFRDLAPRLVFAGAVGLAAASVAALLLWASLYRPLGRVTGAIRAIARGNYRQRVPVSGPSEVRGLAEDVNLMAGSVEASQATLREFLANVSHELKTPLTSIRGFSAAMTDGTLDTPEARARAARVIDAESRRVLHLVEELLDLSRIESGQQKMQLAEIRVWELLTHIEDVFSIRAEDTGIDLHIEPPAAQPVVLADFDRIEQVLGNLLDNAFFHTPRRGRVEVGARDPRGGLVELYVSDSGTGIPPSELPHVFDRFYRADNSSPGSGLGLAISREIVRAHGGDIRAEARPGGGSLFTFTLPSARSAQRPAGESAPLAPMRDRLATD